MSIWIVSWFVLAGALLGFLAWTFLILMRQKSAWRVYATKRKLRYKAGPLMMSPEVQGTIGEHTVHIFSSEHVAEDIRGSRKLTAIEVSLNSVMPVTGGVASGGMIPILKSLDLKQEYTPKHDKWNKSYVAAGNNRYVLEAYLSNERLEALCDLMALRNVWFILVFKDDAMLLRVDTPDPLDEASDVDKLVKQMLAAAEVLELQSGESRHLKDAEVKSATKSVALDVDDDAFASGGFELEDTEPDPAPEADQDSEEKDVPEGDESEKP